MASSQGQPCSEPVHASPRPTAAKVIDTLKWLAPLLGSAGALIHFWRIGYTPSLSLSDLGTVIGAFLLFSLYALALIVVILLAPAAMIHYLVRCHVLPAPPKRSAAKGNTKGLRSFRSMAVATTPLHEKGEKNNGNRRAKQAVATSNANRASPGVTASLILFEIAVAGALALAALQGAVAFIDKCRPWTHAPMWVLYGGGLIAILVTAYVADSSWARLHLKALRRTRVRAPMLFLMYLGYWLAFFALTVGTLPGVLQSVGTVFAVLIVAFILVLHWLLYTTLRMHGTTRFKMLGMGCLLVMAYAKLPLLIVDSAVNRFGLGHMRNVELVTTRNGCEIAQAVWPQLACQPLQPGTTSVYRLGKVDVLTRIGPQFLLAPPGGIADPALPRFTLSSEYVLSWARPRKAKAAEKDCRK